MAQERRQHITCGKVRVSNTFVICWLSLFLVFTLVMGLWVLSGLSAQFPGRMERYVIWRNGFFLFLVVQLAANAAILLAMVSMLHKTTGALPRIEAVLDKVIAGDRSARIAVRRRDNDRICVFVDKLNSILDMGEKK